jgi:hypothetical protein
MVWASTFVAVWYTCTHGMMRGKQFSVDEAVLTRSRQVLVRTLQGGQQR